MKLLKTVLPLVMTLFLLAGCITDSGYPTGGDYDDYDYEDSTDTLSPYDERVRLSIQKLPAGIDPGVSCTVSVLFEAYPGINSYDVEVEILDSLGRTILPGSDIYATVVPFSERETGTIKIAILGGGDENLYRFAVSAYNGYESDSEHFQLSLLKHSATPSVSLGSVYPAICTLSSSEEYCTTSVMFSATPGINSSNVSVEVYDSLNYPVYDYTEINAKVIPFTTKTSGSIDIEMSGAFRYSRYTVKVTAVNDLDSSSRSFTVVKADESSLFDKVKYGQYVYNINGPYAGAYNLVTGTPATIYDDDAGKDLLDISTTTSGITGQLTSGNDTYFTTTDLNFNTATPEDVIEEAWWAYDYETPELLPGDVLVAELGNSRGYALIRINAVRTSGAVEGGGYIQFDYKLIQE